MIEVAEPLFSRKPREQLEDLLKFLGRFLRANGVTHPSSESLAFANAALCQTAADLTAYLFTPLEALESTVNARPPTSPLARQLNPRSKPAEAIDQVKHLVAGRRARR